MERELLVQLHLVVEVEQDLLEEMVLHQLEDLVEMVFNFHQHLEIHHHQWELQALVEHITLPVAVVDLVKLQEALLDLEVEALEVIQQLVLTQVFKIQEVVLAVKVVLADFPVVPVSSSSHTHHKNSQSTHRNS